MFFAGTIGNRDVLFLFGDSDQSHEVSLALSGANGVLGSSSNPSVKISQSSNSIQLVTLLPGIKGLVTIWESDSQVVMFSDPVTAATFWAPTIPSPSSNGLKNFWQFGSNTTVLVGGPYLVRNATLSRSGQLALRGDLNSSAMLTVIGPPQIRSVTWNGELVPDLTGLSSNAAGPASVPSAILTGKLDMKVQTSGIHIPELTGWKFRDSLPEVQTGFSDAAWVVANHTTTNISPKPSFGDGRVLYGEFRFVFFEEWSDLYSCIGCDYGLYVTGGALGIDANC